MTSRTGAPPDPASSLVLDLPPEARSVPRARRWVAGRLSDIGREPLLDAVELLTTEVVTNAVLHAGSAVRVELSRTAGGVRVTVADASVVPVRRGRVPTPTATTGRGSLLLDALSARWGCSVVEGGKVVWFELDLETGAVPGGDAVGAGTLTAAGDRAGGTR